MENKPIFSSTTTPIPPQDLTSSPSQAPNSLVSPTAPNSIVSAAESESPAAQTTPFLNQNQLSEPEKTTNATAINSTVKGRVSGKTIGLIIALIVLVIGNVVFATLYFTSQNHDTSTVPETAKEAEKKPEANQSDNETNSDTDIPSEAIDNLQRNQRNTARHSDYTALVANVVSYLTNNNGKLPSVGTLNANLFINRDGMDPARNPYILKAVSLSDYSSTTPRISEAGTEVFVVHNAKCSSDNTPIQNSAAHSFAVVGALEEGVFCQDYQ